jgi:hypothetical protein
MDKTGMILQGLPSMQTKPNPGFFKRNPPIAGEADAIERAKVGDADAFSKLYALHKRRVYTLCLRMLGNVSEAEDMTQAPPPHRQSRSHAPPQKRPSARIAGRNH